MIMICLINRRNDTVDYVVDEQEDVFENGLYNVTSILTYATTNVTETLRFICELHIPGTNFSLAKQTELLIGKYLILTQDS